MTTRRMIELDMNITVIAGKLAAQPELKTFDSGSKLLRLLITVRSEEPRRRLDVLPVVMWNPSDEVLKSFTTKPVRGRKVWAAGSVQRRFWAEVVGRTSNVEIVAHDIQVRPEEGAEDDDGVIDEGDPNDD